MAGEHGGGRVEWLGRAAAGQVNEGQGGAGIGLSMVARGSEVLQVDVLPAQRTVVVGEAQALERGYVSDN